MTFRRRVTLFFIGVLIGIPIAVYIAKDKNVIKTPSQEIKEMLLRNKLVFSDVEICRMKCLGIDTTTIITMIKNGEINYSKSEVHSKPCKKYTIESINSQQKNISLQLGLCDEETKLLKLYATNKAIDSCDCR